MTQEFGPPIMEEPGASRLPEGGVAPKPCNEKRTGGTATAKVLFPGAITSNILTTYDDLF